MYTVVNGVLKVFHEKEGLWTHNGGLYFGDELLLMDVNSGFYTKQYFFDLIYHMICSEFFYSLEQKQVRYLILKHMDNFLKPKYYATTL